MALDGPAELSHVEARGWAFAVLPQPEKWCSLSGAVVSGQQLVLLEAEAGSGEE